LLPVATVYEKLNFPLKFDREQFVFDFSTCYSSDPENAGLKTRNSSSATSTIQYRLDYVYMDKSKNTATEELHHIRETNDSVSSESSTETGLPSTVQY